MTVRSPLSIEMVWKCPGILIVCTAEHRITRAQRSADAVKEVASLAPTPPKGIDARSLAAKPPQQGFTIRRIDGDYAPRSRGSNGYSAQRGGAARGAARSGASGGARGAARGGAGTSGRGGARVATRGRSGGSRSKRSAGAAAQNASSADAEDVEPPFTKIEEAWIEAHEGGFELPYNPTTSLESLRRQGASVMTPSNPMGAVESLAHKMQVATHMVSAPNTHSGVHLERMARGSGSFFETPEAKAVAQAYYDQKRQADADKRADSEGKERKKIPSRPLKTLDTLPENVRSAIAKAWVAGQYAGPKHVETSNILGQVEMYAKRNETYLPETAKKFEEKLRSLLPPQYQKPEPTPEPKKVQKPL